MVIPEHPDITLEIDKLLTDMSTAEEKLAVMELHYGKMRQKKLYYRDLESFKNIFKKSSKKKCTFVLLV
jgi:hypothetical protein